MKEFFSIKVAFVQVLYTPVYVDFTFSHIILTPGRPVMFRGPSFIITTTKYYHVSRDHYHFKSLWYDWAQQQPGIEPTNHRGQCWLPPIVTFLRSARVNENLFITRELHQEPPTQIPTGSACHHHQLHTICFFVGLL